MGFFARSMSISHDQIDESLCTCPNRAIVASTTARHVPS